VGRERLFVPDFCGSDRLVFLVVTMAGTDDESEPRLLAFAVELEQRAAALAPIEAKPPISWEPSRGREGTPSGLPRTCEDLDHGQSVMGIELYKGGTLGDYCRL
jgi:hypothetical protein